MTNTEKSKILIVDDSQDTLNLIGLGINVYDPPFTIDTAVDAASAILSIQKTNYDAIILDVSLPDITGATLGEIIRKQNPNVPIAFLTNYNGPQTHENAKDIGAQFWFKPEVLSNLENFVQMICKLFSGESCEEKQEHEAKVNPIHFPESLSNLI